LKRRLLLLDLALLALVAAAGLRLRQQWIQARYREQMVLGRTLKPLPPPPMTALPPPEPVRAAAYAEVAEKMLFSRDRNPTVVIEKPPEKPLPPLPALYGVLDLGDGLTAILSEKPGAPGRGVRAGEKVGPFLLVALDAQQAVFDFEGRKVTKKLEELIPRSSPGEAPAAAQRAAAAPPPQPVVQQVAVSGPGASLGGEIRACQPGDTDPPGTVRDGYRKIVTQTPFGAMCRWEPAK
jgi:hypothetical protein